MKALLDADTAVMDQEAFNALPDYSCSLPTGTTIGKRWKRRRDYHDETKGWVMGEYVTHRDPNLTGIVWRDIEVVS